MMEEKSFQLFPESASNIAAQVDAPYAYLVLVSAFFSLLVAFLIVFLRDQVPATPGTGPPVRAAISTITASAA